MSGKVLGVATGLALAGGVLLPLADALMGRRQKRKPAEARYTIVPKPNLDGLKPAPSQPAPGSPSQAASAVASGHAAADEVVRHSRGDRVKSLEAYGRAWRLFGEASEALRASPPAQGGASAAPELERLRKRLMGLQAEGVALLKKLSWVPL